jgi:surfeit locus 1 family protein
MLALLFSRRWWWTTLLVIAAVLVMIRLGIWQLERLEQRRAFNARVAAQLAAAPLALSGAALEADLAAMEYRTVVVTGTYAHDEQIALRNQVWANLPGAHLLTPLRIAGSDRAVLVDRGWVPLADLAPERWGAYDETGVVTVTGRLRRSQPRPDFGPAAEPFPAPGERRSAWSLVNLDAIAVQTRAELLPVWIQQSPAPQRASPPFRSEPTLDLSEGSHLGYAIQWFTFAAILGLGYPLVYLRQQGRQTEPQLNTDGHG